MSFYFDCFNIASRYRLKKRRKRTTRRARGIGWQPVARTRLLIQNKFYHENRRWHSFLAREISFRGSPLHHAGGRAYQGTRIRQEETGENARTDERNPPRGERTEGGKREKNLIILDFKF